MTLTARQVSAKSASGWPAGSKFAGPRRNEVNSRRSTAGGTRVSVLTRDCTGVEPGAAWSTGRLARPATASLLVAPMLLECVGLAGLQAALAQLSSPVMIPEQLMMSQLPGAGGFGHGLHNAWSSSTSQSHWRSSQDSTACPTVELRGAAGISPEIDCSNHQMVCAEPDEPQREVIPDLLLCECAEQCLLAPACTVIVYREERQRAYGLGSQCFLRSSCARAQKHISDTHCSFSAAVTHGDELAARIHQLHGQLGVFPAALQAEAEILAVQLRLQPPSVMQLLRRPTSTPRHCGPPWKSHGLPSSWRNESGLVAWWDVHFGANQRGSKRSGGTTGSRGQDDCDPTRDLLAVLVPVTSRRTNATLGIASVPLLQILVPSLLRTLYLSDDIAEPAAAAHAETGSNAEDDGHNSLDYVLMIGFDEGDTLWVSALKCRCASSFKLSFVKTHTPLSHAVTVYLRPGHTRGASETSGADARRGGSPFFAHICSPQRAHQS